MTPDHTVLQGAALLAQSALTGSTGLPPFPAVLDDLLGDALRQLPPQWQRVGHWGNSGQWIQLAALIESGGLWDEAWDLLVAMADTVTRTDPTSTLHAGVDADVGGEDRTARRTATLAFLCARRGRVARMAGRLETADACYQQALMRADAQAADFFWSDVYPSAWIGRCVLAVERGNYPQARRCALKAMRDGVPRPHQAQAQQMLALIDRKNGKFDRALRYLWGAHDQSDAHPMHQAEILLSLAEVAYQLGDSCAALRARLYVLQQHRSARIVLPALAGILEIVGGQLMSGDRCGRCHQLLALTSWLRTPSGEAGQTPQALEQLASFVAAGHAPSGLYHGEIVPHDLLVLEIAYARLLAAIGDAKRASDIASTVKSAATRMGYHERVFQSEALEVLPQLSDQIRSSSAIVRRAEFDLARCFALDTPANARVGASL